MNTAEERVVFAESMIASAFEIVGLDLADPDLAATPARFVRALSEMTRGYHADVPALLETRFNGHGYDQMILLKGIDFASLCEHHVLPFVGRAHLAYVPSDRVVGLSKLARVVDAFARRLQIQERMTRQIADALDAHLKPLGVAVVLEASHSCMAIRGVGKAGATMTTSDVRGCFRDQPAARAEFFAAIRP